MMKPAGLLACVLSLGLCGTAAHAATQVYKWVDNDGTVHYSAEPPPADAKSKSVMVVHSGIPIDGGASAPASAGTPAATAGSSKGREKANAEDEKVAAANKALCPQWKLELQTLSSVSRLRTSDENGELHYMSEEEKNARVANDQNQIEQYCKD
jgi:hypothetical protein